MGMKLRALDRGLWQQQMLVDRTLREMAALTSSFALAVVISCAVLMPGFVHNLHRAPESSSVTIAGGSCASMKYKTEVNFMSLQAFEV